MSSDWLPGKREHQLALGKDWYAVLTARHISWGIPETVLSNLDNCVDAAGVALGRAQSSDRTPTITAQCREAFDALTALMRDIKDRYYKKPPLVDSDFVNLGLKPKDTIKTPIHVPAGQATALITYPGPHVLMLNVCPLAETPADPRADYGFRIYYGILPQGGATEAEAAGPSRYLIKTAVSGEDLPHSKFTRRRKERFDFPAEDSGKIAHFCIRYENSKGEPGPWGPMFSSFIP